MALGQRTRSVPGGTARRILEHARRAFNERGVGAVGMREIAREMGLSPGNVSYHFPTKEALVFTLIQEGHAQNNALVSAAAAATAGFEQVDATLRAIMRRDLENRWLLRDYVGLLLALPALRPLHEEMQRARAGRVETIVARLVAAGLLDAERVRRRLGPLRQQLFTQVFFWLPSAVASAPDRDPADSLDVHARAALALFLPYCTPSGRRQLESILDGARGERRPRGRTRRVESEARSAIARARRREE